MLTLCVVVFVVVLLGVVLVLLVVLEVVLLLVLGLRLRRRGRLGLEDRLEVVEDVDPELWGDCFHVSEGSSSRKSETKMVVDLSQSVQVDCAPCRGYKT